MKLFECQKCGQLLHFENTRCERCGRTRGYVRKFRLCRICFRSLALDGKLPGVIKASW